MRLLFTALLTVVFVTLEYLDNPRLFAAGGAVAGTTWSKLVHHKDVRIEGLEWLSRTEVERLLPLDRSVAWWMVNAPLIRARLTENPWIGSATVERCNQSLFAEWGCFIVSVRERAPHFLATVDDDVWVISADGAFIHPASQALRNGADARYRTLVTIEGLASRQSSPDLLQAQVAFLTAAIKVLEPAVGRSVIGVTFEGRDDVAVLFDQVPFPVVFAWTPDAPVPLPEQGARCAKLLAQLADRFPDVQRIDLAFSRVGVVKFHGSGSGQRAG